MQARDISNGPPWAVWLIVAVMAVIAGALQRCEPQTPSAALAGHPRLVDGDSFFLGSGEVRLVGIDAPEGRQTCIRDHREWRCGEESKLALARLIGGREITCTSVETDQHGRRLAKCSAGGRDLNAEMVASGQAVAFGARYRRQEDEARRARRGLWAGEFERPQEWRRRHGAGH